MRILVVLVRRSGHWRGIVVRHVLPLVWHRLIRINFIHRHSFAVEVEFHVHLPCGKLFMQSPDNLMAKRLIASHGDEGIAEHIEFASSIVALDNSK